MSDVEMVVNLHVTERCNYRCTYCFGKWGLADESATETSVFADDETAKLVIKKLDEKFGNRAGRSLRFNFVGGEPALLRNIGALVEHVRELGAKASYVSNGMMLQRFDAAWTAENIDVLGISIDSPSASTNLAIGRAQRSGRVFDPALVAAQIHDVRAAAEGLGTTPKVKINTVVSDFNLNEDFSGIIDAIRPDRWKLLKMLPVYTLEHRTTDYDFDAFVGRQRQHLRGAGLREDVISTEDNDQMTGSYVMLDPRARFFWYNSSPGGGYRFSDPITGTLPVDEAWQVVPWDERKFDARYAPYEEEASPVLA